MSALDLLPDYVRAEIASGGKRGLREDLRAIPAAEAAGWTANFRDDCWHNGATFKRGTVAVWWSRCWRARDYADDFPAVPVRLYATLAEALDAEAKPPG